MYTELSVKWSTSRARDTYGYAIVKLIDEDKGEKYRATGGGYDMVGTVFGDWLFSNYKEELTIKVRELFNNNNQIPYGVTHKNGELRYIDGACGLQCMENLAELIGLTVEREYHKRELKGLKVYNKG